MEVKNATELKPIVEKTIKVLYGEGIRNVRILRAHQWPISGSKEWWESKVEFEDDEFKYLVTMNVQMADGTVTKMEEERRTLKITKS